MIRGRKRPKADARGLVAQSDKINATLNASMHNRFDIEVIDAATGKIKQRAQAENVICNALWARLLAPNTYFNYIHYGAGSGTPAAADTSLFTFLDYGTPSTSDDVYTSAWNDGYVSLRRKLQLSELTAVGSTLTEVGIGYSTSSSSLVTHAMLKDMNGNQISIAKTSTDIINIYATVFVHFSTSGYQSSTITFCASPKNTFLLDYLLGRSSQTINSVVFGNGIMPTRYEDTTTNVPYKDVAATFAYSTANKQITITATRLGANDGNTLGGIGSALLRVSFNTGAGPAMIPVVAIKLGETTITGEAIGTGDGETTDFATDFSFPSDATIYVNGVEQTGVTVDNVPLDYTNMGKYFEWMGMFTTGEADGYHRDGDGILPISNVARLQVAGNGSVVYFNPHFAYGIKSYSVDLVRVYVSDDLETWTQIATPSNVPSEHRTKKYWKLETSVQTGGYNIGIYNVTADTLDGKNIHFETAPASGAVITADYTTKTLAKDENHVFDLTVTIQLGEYTV